jgi:hypothetical protein
MTTFLMNERVYAWVCWKCGAPLRQEGPVELVPPRYYRKSSDDYCSTCKTFRNRGTPEAIKN